MQGMGMQGAGMHGTGAQGTGAQGTGAQGTGAQGTWEQGAREQGAAPDSAEADTDAAAALAHGLARLARRRRAMGSRWTSGAQPGQGPAGPEVASPAAGCRDLAALAAGVAACQACPLGAARTQAVPGAGQGARRVLFVGAAPSAEDDRIGAPISGPSGSLLTDIITKGMGLERIRDVAVTTLVKCHPPGGRAPSPAEREGCRPWFERQLELLAPRVVIALGAEAGAALLRLEGPLAQLRGRVHDLAGRQLVVTFHPDELLRDPSQKRACWQDIQLALRAAGLPVPGRG
ncbi:MAG: uracil-DNA glycosylase [Planctomycetota bacterium]